MKKLIAFSLILILLLSGCSSEPALSGIDLYGTYDENDLLIYENVIPLDTDEEIKIPQIKGLLDTKIQDKINTEMHNRAMELIEKHPEITYAHYYTRANFANVISISFSVGFEEEPYSEQLYFNYNLVNGEKLKIEEFFAPEVDLLSIVRHAFYREMAFYGEYDRENKLHSPNENEVYKAVKSFMAKEDKDFTFSPAGIYLYSKNNFGEVKFLDFPEDIVIYSKYITDESIFTGEYEGFKNIFTCADTQYDMFDKIEYGYLEDNLWYDFTAWNTYIPFEDPPSDERLEKFEHFRQKAMDEEYAKLTDYREMAKANPDKFYIVLIKPSFNMDMESDYDDGMWHYTYFDTASVNCHTQLFEMPMGIYNTTYRDKIIETYRYQYFAMRGGAYFDTENLEGATFTETNDEYTHNYMED